MASTQSGYARFCFFVGRSPDEIGTTKHFSGFGIEAANASLNGCAWGAMVG